MRLSKKQISTKKKERESKIKEFDVDEDCVLTRAADHVKMWMGYNSENELRGDNDAHFLTEDQWTDSERGQFQSLLKVALTFNKLEDSVKKVLGEYRDNKMDIKVLASNGGNIKQEEINLREGMLRTISYSSESKLVYQQAFENAITHGMGAFRLSMEYEENSSFNKVLRMRVIKNTSHAFFDPRSEMPHMGDGEFFAHASFYTKEEFEQMFGIEAPASYDFINSDDFVWSTEDSVSVLDHFVREWFPVTIYRLSNGKDITKDKYDLMISEYKEIAKQVEDTSVTSSLIDREIPTIVRKREDSAYKIMHYRMIKDVVLDVEEWPSKFLPGFFVPGNFRYLRGKLYTKSFIHDAIDAQKFVNYVGSEIANDIKNRRREQWVVTDDHIKGYEEMWRNPEVQQGALRANPDPVLNNLPIRLAPSEISQTLLMQFERGTKDIKEILGFHDSNLGARSNELSGIAIENRQIAGSMSATVFFDNLASAIQQCGKSILNMIPAVYSEENRPFVLTKADGDTKPILINQNDKGKIENEITFNDFMVEVSAGPSFGVQKKQMLSIFIELIRVNPSILPLVADILAKVINIQYTPQLVERFKTLVPPQILAKENGEQPPPPPGPSPQQKIMNEEMDLKKREIQIKEEKLSLEKEEMIMKYKKDMADNEVKKMGHESSIYNAETKRSTELLKIHHKNTDL